MTITGFALAQAQYDAAEPDDECQCPEDCDTCCDQCQVDKDDGPDPDDVRDRRIDREMEERDE
jgi:hypothetical protein